MTSSRLRVALAERTSCNAALHADDQRALFGGLPPSRHFCRPLQLQRQGATACFVGWVGDTSLSKGVLELAKPFADCLGLREGEVLEVAVMLNVLTAAGVMVQPDSADDWEVVELQAGYIEQNLLSQIAVLSPGMVFPVWIHGQMPVRLRVDARDENEAECFLLARDSELMIEAKERSTAERAVTVLGPSAAAGSEAEPGLRLRVLDLTCEIDGPVARVHAEDLEFLAGYLARDGCLAWLSPPRPRQQASGGSGGAGSSAGAQQLVRVIADGAVPRGQLVLGSCLASHAGVPRFGFVRLVRCRQVPVYVPRLELVPLGPWAAKQDSSGADAAASSRWVEGLFRDFLNAIGEVDLMDGTVLQLRSKCQDEVVSAPEPAEGDLILGVKAFLPSATSDTTDLYDGLSDIEDIYQSGGLPAPPVQVISTVPGVFELDFGLDEDVSGPFGGVSAAAPVSARAGRPPLLAARVQFALGETRAALRGDAAQPPFVRLTRRALDEEVSVCVSWVGEHAAGRVDEADPVSLLWASTPDLAQLAEEDVERGALRLAHGGLAETLPMSLDELKMYREARASLKANLLAQLGVPSWPGAGPSHPCEPQAPVSVAPGAVAVIGASGSGKTTLCRRVLGELAADGVFALEVSCGKIGQPSRKFTAVQRLLTDILRLACRHAPSAVFFDDFGALCPDVEPGAPNLSVVEERSPILSELLLDLLPALRGCGARVALCATLPSDAAVHRALWRPPALEHKVMLRPPLLKERPDILQRLLRQRAAEGWHVEGALLHEGALDSWGGKVDGFTVADLSGLVHRACIEAESEAGQGLLLFRGAAPADGAHDGLREPQLCARHLERAVEGFVPSSMADQSFLTSDVKLADIGGLAEAKQELMDMLTMPTKYAVLMDRAPVRCRKGIMLVGPPGCGKTFLVQAAAHETKGLLRFLTVKGPELLSKYIGESEAGVRRVFERAAAAAPAVIFFDEIEALAPKRGADSTGVTDRVVNQMLCYLDGVEDRGRVYVIAASGRPDLVDAALLRPGRFDRICYCGLPTETEKLDICSVLAKKNGLEIDQDGLSALVAKIPRLFSSADLNGLFSTAKIEAVNEALARGAAAPSVSIAHVYTALSSAKASISAADEQRYNKVFEAYHGSKQSALERTGPKGVSGQRVALV